MKLNGMGVKKMSLVSLFFYYTCFVSQSWAAEITSGQFRGAVEREKPKLGKLEPWQSDAFDQEVLASSGRFIKDYQTQDQTLSKVEVDTDAIKKYLGFHATQIFKPENSKILLTVRVAEDCSACVAAAGSVREDLRRRFARRGLQVISLEKDEARRDLVEMLGIKSASGYVLARLRQIEDPEHAGDFKIKIDIEARFPGTLLTVIQKQMEIMTSESVEIAVSRMLIDLLSEAGQKIRLAQLGALETTGGQGIDLKIQGCLQYSQCRQLKQKLQDKLRTDARVVEKRLSSQEFVIAVISQLSVQEISQAIYQLKLEGLKARVISNEGKALRLLIEPIQETDAHEG